MENTTLRPAFTASTASAVARWLLPVPGGPRRCKTSARSMKVSSASARMRLRSSEGWKAKSKPASALRQLTHFNETARAVGNAVIIAADRDEAVVADPPFQLQERIKRDCRQGLQVRFLGGKCLGDDSLRRRMQPHVGDGVEPVPQLSVQVVEVAERPGQEEVLADIAEGALDLAFCLCPLKGRQARGWKP